MTSPKYPALPPSRDSVAKACKSQELGELRGFGRFTDKISIGLYVWLKVIKCSLKYFAWNLVEIICLCHFQSLRTQIFINLNAFWNARLVCIVSYPYLSPVWHICWKILC